jgi:hypothetical protein
MKIYLNEYKKACTDYKQNWALLNEILYKMCKDCRFHKNLSAINAKVWIIGRTYATGIERMISSIGAQGDSLGQLAKHMYKNRTILDSIFNRLLSIREPFRIPVIMTPLMALLNVFSKCRFLCPQGDGGKILGPGCLRPGQ